MDDGVAGVLPALVVVAVATPALVLLQSVAVPVAELVAPAQGGAGRLEVLLEQRLLAGPAPGMPERQAIEGRGIVGPVVRGVRNPTEVGELAPAELVRQLARLGVAPVVSLPRLQCSQRRERATGLRDARQARHQRRQERVAAEQCVEPRHACRNVRGALVLGHGQRVEIRAAPHERVAQQRRRLQVDCRPALRRRLLGVRIAGEADDASGDLRPRLETERLLLTRPQRQVEDDLRPDELGFAVRTGEGDVDAAPEAATVVDEPQAAAVGDALDSQTWRHSSVLDLEDVCEVGIELDDQSAANDGARVAAHRDVVVQGAGDAPLEPQEEAALGQLLARVGDRRALKRPLRRAVPGALPPQKLPALPADRDTVG